MKFTTKLGAVVATGVAAYGAFTVLRQLRQVNAAKTQIQQGAGAAAEKATEVAEAIVAKATDLLTDALDRGTAFADRVLTKAGDTIDQLKAEQVEREKAAAEAEAASFVTKPYADETFGGHYAGRGNQ